MKRWQMALSVLITVFPLVCFIALGAGVLLSAQPRLSWAVDCRNTLNDAVARLNQLPEARQLEASIVTIPSERNYGGWFGSPYCVLHRR